MSSQDYQYDEGGGEYPPYKEDYFQRITQVNWPSAVGGIFISGGPNSRANISDQYGKIDNLQKPLVMQRLQLQRFFGYNGVVNAASYANVGAKLDGSGGSPTFLLAGNDDGSTGGDLQNQVGVIVVSSDGLNWTQALKLEENRGDWQNFAAILELVWHKRTQAFYAGVYSYQVSVIGHDLTGDPILAATLYTSLYKSADGRKWNKIDEQTYPPGAFPSSINSPLQEGDLYNPNTNLPDGVSSYWEKLTATSVVAESVAVIPSNPPTPDYRHGFLNSPAVGPIRAIHFKGTNFETISLQQGNIGCYAGGVYVVASANGADGQYPDLWASNDKGKSWYSAGQCVYAFNAVSAGPLVDQRKAK